MADKKARLTVDGLEEAIELPVYSGTEGPDVIDVRPLTGQGLFTYDPGFVSTAACESKLTYIDGGNGVLLHGGYPIEQLAQNADYLEVCYLLLNGELPTAEQKETFVNTVTNHTMVHEQMSHFFNGFRRDAHPMAYTLADEDTPGWMARPLDGSGGQDPAQPLRAAIASSSSHVSGAYRHESVQECPSSSWP